MMVVTKSQLEISSTCILWYVTIFILYKYTVFVNVFVLDLIVVTLAFPSLTS